MKKFKLALLILGISLFASCSGDVVENTVNDETTMAKLTVLVRDITTGDTINGAEVSLQSAKPVVTKDGKASFKNVRIGTHNLKVEKAGYASVIETAEIGINLININATETEYDFTASEGLLTVNLNPEAVTLYGYLFYTTTKAQELPAEGVKVYLELTERFVKRFFETETDANGKYTFEKVPAGATGKIWAAAPEAGLDGIQYENITILDGTSAISTISGNVYINRKNFTTNNVEFEASYNSTVAKDGNIVFTFTEAIDQSQVKINETVKVTSSGINNQASIKYGTNTVTISPLREWEQDVEIKFSGLKSISGKTFSNTKTITLQLKDLSGKAVDGITVFPQTKLDYNETQVALRWNLVEGATQYVIYRRYSDTSSYVAFDYVDEVKGATLGSKSISLGDGGEYLNGRTVSFLVQAKNNTSISPLDTTKAHKVFDEINPITSPGSYSNCLIFSEPVNKKALKISPEVAEERRSYTDYTQDEDYTTAICLHPTVSSTTQYTITGIQDQKGNTNAGATVTVNP